MKRELQIREATNSEHSMMYSTSKECDMIGHLRFSFDSAGSFHCTWHGCNGMEPTQDFQNEFAFAIGKLRAEGGILNEWQNAVNARYESENGYVTELDGFTGYIRLPDTRGDYGYIYFYEKKAQCYMVVSSKHDGSCEVYLFSDEEKAKRRMHEDAEAEVVELKTDEFNPVIEESPAGIDVYIPSTDIYAKWRMYVISMDRGNNLLEFLNEKTAV